MKKLDCIMLIDDNEDDNFIHSMVLRQMDVANHIEIAEDSFQALDYLKTNDKVPQLIFLDINMPKMNGWEFLDEYRRLNAGQQAKVIIIMLTTSLNPSDKEKSKQIPEINGFEPKPLTPEIVNRVVQKFL